MSNQLCKPDVFIVGFQKCGSSTLFDYLTKHPLIQGSKPKETFFLTDEFYDHYSSDLNFSVEGASWEHFFRSRAEQEKLLEASVCHFYQETALNYLKSVNTEAKVIFILRDPIDRFISIYKYLYGKTGWIPPEDSLDLFYEKVKAGIYHPDLLKYAIEHGHYSKFLDHWITELGTERILVLGFNDLIHRIENLGHQVFQFLDLEPLPVHTGNLHKNQSTSYRFPYLHRVLVGFFGGSWISIPLMHRIYNRFFTKKINPSLSEQYRKELKQIYNEQYRRYANLF